MSASCDCNGMSFIANRWVFTGECMHRTANTRPAPVPKTQCPECRACVVIGSLDYGSNVQRTECPNGHAVSRAWNGPESPEYDRTKPYGWSAWDRV